MLRKGIVALMMTVMSVGQLQADDTEKTGKLASWLRGPAIGRTQQVTRSTGTRNGVKHAVVDDAERQVPEIHQTSGGPPSGQLEPTESVPQPLPIQYAPVLPNVSEVSGPQYFSAATSNGPAMPVHPGGNWQQYAPPVGVNENSQSPYSFASNSGPVPMGPVSMTTYGNSGPMYNNQAYGGDGGPYAGGGSYSGGSYGGNGAPLYPAPIPGIPQQVGGTAFVHQALQPHEMLYPHRYKAMYGPYYYKVNGGWIVTPFGVWSNENWKLQGTTVDVKYKSHISPFTLFKPPVIR